MKKILVTVVLSTLVFPFISNAQTINREGIFDCNQNGAYSMSVGALSAIGGIYVPVNDAAVTLNTGTLVYKECILREIIDRMRESALSALLKQMNTAIQTGRQGNAMYVTQEGNEESLVGGKAYLFPLDNGGLNNLNPTLKSTVDRALRIGFRNGALDKTSALKCAYTGDLTALENAAPGSFSFEGLYALGDPACNPLGAYYTADTLLTAREAKAIDYQRNQWNWGAGYYARTDNAADPLAEQVVTPSSVIQQSYQQMLGSPVRQLESANDIGQMIGALYAGVTTQAVNDSGGLAGLTQSVGGQASYLDQVVSQSSEGLRTVIVNDAVTSASANLQAETTYLGYINDEIAALSSVDSRLRAAEAACWVDVVPKVQDYADANSITIHVATSTAFSDAAINANAGTALSTITAQQTAEKALITHLVQLISDMSGTSQTAQQRAIAEYSNLVAANTYKALGHTTALSATRDSIIAQAADIVDKTRKRWVGLYPDEVNSNTSWDQTVSAQTVGWCNVRANTTTAASWASKWSN